MFCEHLFVPVSVELVEFVDKNGMFGALKNRSASKLP